MLFLEKHKYLLKIKFKVNCVQKIMHFATGYLFISESLTNQNSHMPPLLFMKYHVECQFCTNLDLLKSCNFIDPLLILVGDKLDSENVLVIVQIFFVKTSNVSQCLLDNMKSFSSKLYIDSLGYTLLFSIIKNLVLMILAHN
jgi:hypothetical protein